MPLQADAARWWEDPDLHELRERIERRRAREARQAPTSRRSAPARPLRGVREVRGIAREPLVSAHLQTPATFDIARQGGDPRSRASQSAARAAQGIGVPRGLGRARRPRPRAIERIGPRPDMIAAWAVVLGVVLLIVAILSAHG